LEDILKESPGLPAPPMDGPEAPPPSEDEYGPEGI
jgi:hypothetical protein